MPSERRLWPVKSLVRDLKGFQKWLDVSHFTVQKIVYNNYHHAQVWLSKQNNPQSTQQDAERSPPKSRSVITVTTVGSGYCQCENAWLCSHRDINKFDFNGRYARKEPSLSKKNIEARLKLTGESWTKTKTFGIMFFQQMSLKWNYLDTRTEHVFSVNQIQPSEKRSSCQLWSMEMTVSPSGDPLLQEDLASSTL